MPYVGLIVTSAGFLIPMMVAHRLHKYEERDLLGSLATSSLLYHGTVHPMAKFLDIGVAHLVSVQFLCRGMKRMMRNMMWNDITGMALSGLSMWMYYARSTQILNEAISRRWHMGVHITAQLALLCFVDHQEKLKSHPITIEPEEEWIHGLPEPGRSLDMCVEHLACWKWWRSLRKKT